MCEYCGCRQVEPIAQLMDEHLHLLDVLEKARRLLATGGRHEAWAELSRFADDLERHVRVEERGVLAALRQQGDFAGAVDGLEREHVELDEALCELGRDDADLEDALASFAGRLTHHIDQEDLGIFPLAVVTLGADGWNVVADAHERGRL